MRMYVQVEGLDKIVRKLDELTAKPLRNALTRSGLIVERATKLKITEMGAVDTGRLRGSITYIVDPGPVPTWVQVGTNVKYAKWIHDGTKPHMPPVAALSRWARKRGLNPYLVARKIARFGTRARPFLREAFEESRGAVQATLLHAAEEIKARWAA